MFILIVRCLIIYFILLIIVRFMGKRQIGQLQPFELVITLILAELAILPMQENGMPLINGIVPLFTLVSIHFFISFIGQKSFFLRKIISGKPVVLISPKGIEHENLKSLNMNLNELTESLRDLGYFDLANIEYAIAETNGKITALSKSSKRFITPEDLKIKTKQTPLAISLILDGKIIKENMKEMNITKEFLNIQLKKVKITDTKNVFIATLNGIGQMYIQEYNKQYISLETNYKKGEQK